MDKYTLDPTEENIRLSIEKDATGRNDALYSFIEMLNNLDGLSHIAIDAKWGAGKTFFVKEVKYLLDKLARGEGIESLLSVSKQRSFDDLKKIKYHTVYFDAWEHDNDEDPILSLTDELANSSLLQDYGRVLTNLLEIALEIATGLNIKGFGKIIDSLKKVREVKEARVNNKDKFVEELDKLTPEDNDRTIIFIDELDRCKPTYAIQLLERIKHYFINDKIIFVFSININELQNTVRRYYGEQFDGEHYLYRFFEVLLKLPEPNLDNYYEMIDISANRRGFYLSHCTYLANRFNFSLRQLNQFLLLSNSATAYARSYFKNLNPLSTDEEKVDNVLLPIFILPYMIALRMASNREYDNFIHGDGAGTLAGDLIGSKSFRVYMARDFKKNKEELEPVLIKLYEVLFTEHSNGPEDLGGLLIEDPAEQYKKLTSACSMVSHYVKYN